MNENLEKIMDNTPEEVTPTELPKEAVPKQSSNGHDILAHIFDAARKNPRDLEVVSNKIAAVGLRNPEDAATLFYRYKIQGKEIFGGSIRLAELLAYCCGNISIEVVSVKVSQDKKSVVAVVTGVDYENVTKWTLSLTRQVHGTSPEALTRTTNSLTSILVRNVIFKLIPPVVWMPLLRAAEKVAAGTAEALPKRRKKMLKQFKIKYNITTRQILSYLDRPTVNTITASQLHDLVGLWSALDLGEVGIDEIFNQSNPAKELEEKLSV